MGEGQRVMRCGSDVGRLRRLKILMVIWEEREGKTEGARLW